MFASRLLGAVLAAAVGFVPIVPPEHVHETDEHGHHQLLVHRHSEAHRISHHATRHDGQFDDDDAPVLTLAPAYIAPSAPVGAVAAPSSVIRLIPPPPVALLHPPVGFVERLIHGPPRSPAAPRAPPSPLAS